jgi:Coenzyme PQQ synthesis protein D (PqqD)
MTAKNDELTPRARKDGLVVRELSGELLVYDRDRNKAHCLNETAALIWKLCDGQTTVSRMGSLLRDQSSAQVDEQVIWYALDQFAKDHLLEERVKRPPEMGRVSRRELIQRIGLAASIPLVLSVLAPTVFAAASCTQLCPINVTQCTVPGCTVSCMNGHCSAT